MDFHGTEKWKGSLDGRWWGETRPRRGGGQVQLRKARRALEQSSGSEAGHQT